MGNEDVLSHSFSKENDKKRDSLLHESICLHEFVNMRMTQNFQHRIPHVVFVIFRGFRRRERGRSV